MYHLKMLNVIPIGQPQKKNKKHHSKRENRILLFPNIAFRQNKKNNATLFLAAIYIIGYKPELYWFFLRFFIVHVSNF